MGELFSANWMQSLQKKWNADPNIIEPLHNAEFSAIIAYGFKDEPKPRGILVIELGKVIEAGSYVDDPPDWDLRATPGKWEVWLKEGLGLPLPQVHWSSHTATIAR